MKAYIWKGKVAKAKIILHLDKSQLPHARLDTAKEIWDNLGCIHCAHGFGTLLPMRQKFFYMVMDEEKSMEAWIASVRDMAKAEHECTCELPRFILMSILHAILLTWILTGSTIWVTRIHESSTCAMRVTHHGSDSLEYLRVPIGTHEYLQTTITNGLYISFSIQNLVYINGNNFGLRYFFTFPPFRPLALVLESYNDFVTRDCWWEITP
jgi:hypothetical protein